MAAPAAPSACGYAQPPDWLPVTRGLHPRVTLSFRAAGLPVALSLRCGVPFSRR
jgi:hypothetical protein